MSAVSSHRLQVGQRLIQQASTFLASKRLIWLIVGFGIMIRFIQYLADRSLWLDESLLVLNITHRTFAGLLQPLDNGQAAPVGFLLLERLVVQIFGSSEYALRLVPFLAGCVALVLFYRVAVACIKPEAVPIALLLFAISGPLIYYSSEVKQYSCDVAIALLLLLMAIDVYPKKLTALRVAILAVVGAGALWFSHPAVFVLGGIGAGLGLCCILKRDWKYLRSLLVVYLCWTVSFISNYLVSLRYISSNQALQGFWNDAYMPLLPHSLSDLHWFIDTFFTIFQNPVGLGPYAAGIAALLFLVGSVVLYRARRERFWLLLAPIFLALFASGLHKYPFGGRLLLFAAPVLILLIAHGLQQVSARVGNGRIATVAILGVLCIDPVISATYMVVRPSTKEEVRPALAYIHAHMQPGDLLYVYYGAQYAFEYYQEDNKYAIQQYQIGTSARDNWNAYVDELNRLRGNQRVWFLFSHVRRKEGVDEEKFFLYQLDQIGPRLDTFTVTGASVYLYNLKDQALNHQ